MGLYLALQDLGILNHIHNKDLGDFLHKKAMYFIHVKDLKMAEKYVHAEVQLNISKLSLTR